MLILICKAGYMYDIQDFMLGAPESFITTDRQRFFFVLINRNFQDKKKTFIIYFPPVFFVFSLGQTSYHYLILMLRKKIEKTRSFVVYFFINIWQSSDWFINKNSVSYVNAERYLKSHRCLVRGRQCEMNLTDVELRHHRKYSE